ncbi:MAG TPA: hypothetical protein VFA69_03830 [Candidatus Nitrosotalea sp.]|nr:hypothetical protein [Candidatus Nitrosotalea sp.]
MSPRYTPVLIIGIIISIVIASHPVFADISTNMKITGNIHPRYSTDNSYTITFQNPPTSDITIQLALKDTGGKTMITLTPLSVQKNSNSVPFTLYFTPGVGIDSGQTYVIIALNGADYALYPITPVSSDKEMIAIEQPVLKLHSVTESLIQNKWNVGLLACAGDDAMDSTWIKISSDISKETYHVNLGLGPHACSIVDYVVEAKIPVSIQASFENQESPTVPNWIKKNAKLWSTSQISDSDFIEGMRYLISTGIVDVPSTPPATDSSEHIPSWIKTNAGQWADGWISDGDFLRGMQYLISNGIMRV